MSDKIIYGGINPDDYETPNIKQGNFKEYTPEMVIEEQAIKIMDQQKTIEDLETGLKIASRHLAYIKRCIKEAIK